MAVKKFNIDLDIQGKLGVTNVPNASGDLLTYNGQTVSRRTYSQIISDLKLAETTWVNTNFIPKSHPTFAVTQAQINNWDTAFGWGTHIGLYPLRASLGGSENSIRVNDTRNTNPLPTTDLQQGAWFDFKTSSAIELTGASSYAGVMTLVPSGSGSGNNNTAFRLAQSKNKLFFQNYGSGAWNPWNELLTTDKGVPYTGATKDVDLGNNKLSLSGTFERKSNVFDINHLANDGTGSPHFKLLRDVASLSRSSDSTTVGDIIITIPITTTTRWVMEVDISNKSTHSKLLISGYSTSNSSRKVAFISGDNIITGVKFGRMGTSTVLILKRGTTATAFTYGSVNISKFYHFVTYSAVLADKANYKVEFLDETTLEGFTLNGTIPNTSFQSDFNTVPITRQIIAGNGLTGGGDLSSNKTITLGTPSTIEANSVNSVTSTGHTHLIETSDVNLSTDLNKDLTGFVSGLTGSPVPGSSIIGFFGTLRSNKAYGAGIFARDKRAWIASRENNSFQGFTEIWTINNLNPDNYSPSTHTHKFSELTDKPTKLIGYGIDDAYTKVETDANIKDAVDNLKIEGRNLFYNDYSLVNTSGTYGLFINFPVGVDKVMLIEDRDTSVTLPANVALGISGGTAGFTPMYVNGNLNISRLYKDFQHVYFYPKTKATFDLLNKRFKIGVFLNKNQNSWTPAPEDQIADWNQTDDTAFDFIKNKPTADIAKGVEAYSWDNHATQGYLKAANLNGYATQTWVTDNYIAKTHAVNAITTTNISNWNKAFGSGDHATQGYLKSANLTGYALQSWVTDNYIAKTHAANAITSALITNWNNAYSYSQVGHIPLTQRGAANGVATLDSNGLVPPEQLPSYVDDVIEAANLAALNALPIIQKMTGKIYVTLDTNRTYRWSGTQFVMIATGEVDSVNGKKGVVTLTTSDINEGTNQYFTTARARASISQGTGVTYNSSTGQISVNYGTTAGTAAQGNDSRINNGQTAFGWENHATQGYLKLADLPRPSIVTSTTATGITNVATTNTNTFLNLVYNGTSVAPGTQIAGAGSVSVSSDTSGKITITGTNTTYSAGTLAILQAASPTTTNYLWSSKNLNDWLTPKLNNYVKKDGDVVTGPISSANPTGTSVKHYKLSAFENVDEAGLYDINNKKIATIGVSKPNIDDYTYGNGAITVSEDNLGGQKTNKFNTVISGNLEVEKSLYANHVKVTGTETTAVETFVDSTQTYAICSAFDYKWADNIWRVGIKRGGGMDSPGFAFNFNGVQEALLEPGGYLSLQGGMNTGEIETHSLYSYGFGYFEGELTTDANIISYGNAYISNTSGGIPTISVAIGDNDTGFNWISDGSLSYVSNGTKQFNFDQLIYGNSAAGTINGWDGTPSDWKPTRSGFYRPNTKGNYGELLMWVSHSNDTETHGAGIGFNYGGTEAFITGRNGFGGKNPNRKIWHEGNLDPATLGKTYTAGTNISISGTTISVSNSPTFSGNVTAPGFFMSSARDLKKNIKPYEESALELIQELDIVSFDYKNGAKNKVGVIAEDTNPIFLSEKRDAVDLYNTVFLQAKAIQELKEEIEELKKVINHAG